MDWLKKGIEAVYSKDGWWGLVVVAVLLGGLLWLFGDKVLTILGG